MIKSFTKKNLIPLGLAALTILGVSGCSETQKSVELQGAGATFPYPLYSKMFDVYHKENNVKINYQAIGSGGGIRQLKNETVNFGASDAFMKDSALKELKNQILHIPICLGAVSISYNLDTVSNLKLTPKVLSDIFLGKITKWNAPQIQKINPGVSLPDQRIVNVYRSDGSGTTFIFTDYLSKVSPDWKKTVGRGKSVNWPVGLGGKGNAGVAGVIAQTPGSIGYIGHIYAIQNNMPVAKLQNKKGKFIEPSIASVSKAAKTPIPEDTRASITDSEATEGYPISGFTWILVYKDQNFNNQTKAQAKEIKSLVEWMIGKGQALAEPLHYAPLPDSVALKAQKIIDSMHYAGEKI